ncbi:MAG: hypothetical protein KAX38_03920, partial [Candidatus Krumholzibacteria bacterium]|nr:hypothetical protein [Candidatus Krumholzibacteria bacterium]
MFNMGERIILDIELWKIVLGMGLVAFSFFVYRRTFPPISLSRRIVLAVLRVFGFIVLVFYTLNPALISITREVRKPLVLVMLDVSKSMGIRDSHGRSRIEEAGTGLRRFYRSLRNISGAEME